MHFPFSHPITNSSRPEEQASVIPHEPQSISVEGSEFLDDGLRMEDMPPHTEESVAPGAPYWMSKKGATKPFAR